MTTEQYPSPALAAKLEDVRAFAAEAYAMLDQAFKPAHRKDGRKLVSKMIELTGHVVVAQMQELQQAGDVLTPENVAMVSAAARDAMAKTLADHWSTRERDLSHRAAQLDQRERERDLADHDLSHRAALLDQRERDLAEREQQFAMLRAQADALQDVARALTTKQEPVPPPTIVVNVPEQPAPVINVEPIINVQTPRRRRTVESFDGSGRPTATIEEDIDG
jgi:hypothetical protein